MEESRAGLPSSHPLRACPAQIPRPAHIPRPAQLPPGTHPSPYPVHRPYYKTEPAHLVYLNRNTAPTEEAASFPAKTHPVAEKVSGSALAAR